MRNIHRPHHYYKRARDDAPDTAPRIGRGYRYELSDLESVLVHHKQFSRRFPRASPSYVIGGRKCNADAAFVQAVAQPEEGQQQCSFSCRSIEAVRLVSAHAAPSRENNNSFVMFSSPCKSKKNIAEAYSKHGVRHMTVESVPDVVRISAISKDIDLLLRISPVEEGAAGRKHNSNGATRDKWADILRSAKGRGMAVVGISLQLSDDQDGSQCSLQPNRLDTTLSRVREAFDLACSDEFGFAMSVVDVGAALVAPFDEWRMGNSCSFTIVEEDGSDDNAVGPNETSLKNKEREQKYGPDSLDYSDNLLKKYFPDCEKVVLLAEPAQYVLPDESVAIKWWGTPKVRRTAPSLHAHLMQYGTIGRGAGQGVGLRASLKNCGGYRPCCKRTQVVSRVLEHPPSQVVAAAQA
uniref:Orn/DAP/Arg decarboxylase 2 N-terminal domain-containing protein n=1 Tax=Pseudictyota dubia TaxID=2749911 RepID=A0A7R9WLH1_9STRA|mmetsp:Transcript_9922/g.18892  ORF Transcript_9922/g.18892 Transcript_9922/m.18892 type:complete len:408 (+) Transcript_9922:182-1405(+)